MGEKTTLSDKLKPLHMKKARRNLKRENESFLIEALKNSVRTNFVKTNVDNAWNVDYLCKSKVKEMKQVCISYVNAATGPKGL